MTSTAALSGESSRIPHFRHGSQPVFPIPDPNVPKSPSPSLKPPGTIPIQYTLFIRLPFSRPQNFQDPAPTQWDSTKDRALWKLISKASNSRDLDWEGTADKFGVELAFLMQQAAWLYERHFAGMRAQMLKLAGTGTDGSTPLPGEGSSGSRTSKDSRTSSALATHKGSPVLQGETGSQSGTSRMAMAPPFSRTPSTTTITQSRLGTAAGSRQLLQRPLRASGGSQQQRRPISPLKHPVESSLDDSSSSALEHDHVVREERSGSEGSHDEQEEEESPYVARSQAFRRPPLRNRKPALGTLSSSGEREDAGSDDDEDSSSAGYLPFAAASKPGRGDDPSATLRGVPKRHAAGAGASGIARTQYEGGRKETEREGTTISSSASSASSAQPPASSEGGSRVLSQGQIKPGPLSPRHRAQLAQQVRKDVREGSEKAPSMGSSFSDLDDASVTQSAMEDALLSMQRHGSIASRMSNISNAFRSRQL